MLGYEGKGIKHKEINEDLISTPASVEKKEKILVAAEKLFGDLGFEGVSTRLLAKEAGVNMAMLAYYFGSKEKLFKYMIQRRAEDGRARILELINTDQSHKEKINQVIDFYVDRLFDSGPMHALFLREISLLQRSTVSSVICQSLTDNLLYISQIIKDGQQAGEFRKVDMEFTVVSMIGTISYVVNSPAMARMIFNIKDDEALYKNETFRKRTKTHLKDMIHTHLESGPLKSEQSVA